MITIKDIYNTRFSDDKTIVILQENGYTAESAFGTQHCHNELYRGQIVNIPVSIFDIKVRTIKAVNSHDPEIYMVLFCYQN